MADEDTITIDSGAGDVLIDTSAYSYNITSALGSSASIYTTIGMNSTSGQYLTNSGTGASPVWTTNNTTPWGMGNITPSPGLKVSGDAEFEGKVMINGRNISEFMETISKRLSILVPDPAKLEHFAALKKAYEHYKTLEALCEIPKKENEE
jgi:hypothetical protein